MDHEVQAKEPHRFHLVRHEDETGVSGEGIVAQGLEFPSGYCLMRWVVPPAQSTAFYESIEDLIKIHGHNGKTEVKYLVGGPGLGLIGSSTESTVMALDNLAKLTLAYP